MKIITVNLPESYIDAMVHICGDNKMYSSRSEMIRIAVREYLIEKIDEGHAFIEFNKEHGGYVPSE